MGDYRGLTCSSVLRDVDADFINPFLLAAHEVFLSLGKYPATKGSLSLIGIDHFSDCVMIVMQVEGELRGTVIFAIDEDTAKKFASSFLMGLPVNSVDAMALNSLRDFSIRVTEKAKKHLGQLGHLTNVRFEVFFNQSVPLSHASPFLTLSLNTPHGPIKVYFNIVRTH